MILRKSIVVSAIALIIISAVSCAKTGDGILTPADSQESFERWVAKYAPNAQKIESGVFLEFHSRDGSWEQSAAPVLNKSWVLMNFTGYNMRNTIFGTRDSSTSKLLGTWAYTTHFVPQLVQFYQYNTVLCDGLKVAIKHLRAGDKARVFVPGSLAASAGTFLNGYIIGSTTYEGYPVYYDVDIKEIINDPSKWEDSLVNDYVHKKWNYTLKDTIAKGLYMRTLVANAKGDTITKDSTVRLWKTLRFLDGQLLSTNVDSVAKADHYFGLEQTVKDYTVMNISPSNFANDYAISNQVYSKIVPLMRTGEQAEVVATSIWGVGSQGVLQNIPQIGSFEPLIYKFQTLNRTDTITK